MARGCTFRRLPVVRLSTTTTSSSRRARASTTWEPMKPAPPVTRIAMPASSLGEPSPLPGPEVADPVGAEVDLGPDPGGVDDPAAVLERGDDLVDGGKEVLAVVGHNEEGVELGQ